MSFHFFLNEVRSEYYGQGPVLILTDRHENIFFLEQVNFFGPSLDTFVAVADSIAIFATVWPQLLLLMLWRFLELCEELRVEDINFLIHWLFNNVVL